MGIGGNQTIELSDAYEQIINSVVATLESEIGVGGKLEGITTVIRGDRARSKPREPVLWVFPETARPSQNHGLKEKWELPLVISAVVKNVNPEEGCIESTRFSARARTVILQNSRTLGLDGIVTDVSSGNFSPAAPWSSRDALHGSAAIIVVKFMTFEH